jgi:hypothetical protein
MRSVCRLESTRHSGISHIPQEDVRIDLYTTWETQACCETELPSEAVQSGGKTGGSEAQETAHDALDQFAKKVEQGQNETLANP